MPKIHVKDLKAEKKLTKKQMAGVRGGQGGDGSGSQGSGNGLTASEIADARQKEWLEFLKQHAFHKRGQGWALGLGRKRSSYT